MKIDIVAIKNFKSLKDIELKLSSLTLITGVNSSGKSSFIQVFLLMRDNINFYRQPTNKTYIFASELGDKKSLLHQNSLREKIIFEFDCNDTVFGVKLDSKFVAECFGNCKNNNSLIDFFENNFYYLNTDRIAPSLTFPYSEVALENNLIGEKGEFTTHYLAENKHHKLTIEALQHPESTTLELLENTYKWMSDISSGVTISASADPSTQSAKLTYQYEYGKHTSSNYSPLNVGFGLTYVLPVIVLILKAKPGDLLIIENPESHLHPKGQSKIAELCAIAAHNGVQIIVESHSDHFLNGLRVATKNKIIAPNESQTYFFKKEVDSLDTVVDAINIDNDGNLNDYPKDFFDEWDNNLDKLLW
jgi:predicted ATPase